ncbi:hypothetical protein MNBD_GAMMA18-1890 [hydrothermal vent metagenome]|uniref:DUF481 domain-containing protein n=1 Tax=hydrothermal vent metagenome TaxID=652676 RepID=A0A3B0Z9V1_9ZZZZ
MKPLMLSSSIAALLFSVTAHASPFTGEAELGWISTSGNSKTDSLNIKAKGEKTYGKIKHHLTGEVLNSSSAEATTAERYLLGYKADYTVTDKGYVFLSLNYEKDRFSGYDQRTNELLGYGRQFHDNETLKTRAELSVGARQSKLDDGGSSENEMVVKVQGNLEWTVSETALFSQDVAVEVGDDSTISKSITGLKVNINSSLAMKLTYTVKHTSEVPDGVKKLDSERVATIVYSF